MHRTLLSSLVMLSTAVTTSLLVGCDPTGPTVKPGGSASPSHSAATAAAAVVTILYTADESGALLPHLEAGKALGGAAEMLGSWIDSEKHCTGGPGTAKPCSSPTTLALSGGDSFTGPAISTAFQGEPVAEAMKKMGYAASALGNHDLDFGRLQFVKNKKIAQVEYVGANVKITNPEMNDLLMPPFFMAERQGVKIAVIGLASVTTGTRAMANRFDGVEFQAPEEALSKAVPDAWKAGADAVVVIAHECPDKLVSIFGNHKDWKVSFVGGANCHKSFEDRSTGAIMMAPDWKLRQYARVEMKIDKARPAKERVVSVAAKFIDVTRAEGATTPPVDPSLQTLTDTWKKKLDTTLGEEIGYTGTGFERDKEARRWVTGAWLKELNVDVAIMNAKGIVDSVPSGPITKAAVYTIMPYDNTLLVVELSGADLIQNLDNPEAIFSGATKEGKTYKIAGKPIDPAAKYKVATIEYLYFGGDGFLFEKQDPEPKETGMDWRTPVIEWSSKQGSSKASPLEKKLP